MVHEKSLQNFLLYEQTNKQTPLKKLHYMGEQHWCLLAGFNPKSQCQVWDISLYKLWVREPSEIDKIIWAEALVAYQTVQ